MEIIAQSISQLEALQNSVRYFDLNLIIKYEGKKKGKPMFKVLNKQGKSVSQEGTYNEINFFLMGYQKAATTTNI